MAVLLKNWISISICAISIAAVFFFAQIEFSENLTELSLRVQQTKFINSENQAGFLSNSPQTNSALKLGVDVPHINEEVRVFLIHSYPDGRWTRNITKGLESKLRSQGLKASLSIHYSSKQLQLTLDKKVNEFNPDYIVIADDEAASRYLEQAVKFKVPVLLTGISRRAGDISLLSRHRHKIAVVFERIPIETSFRLLKDLSKNPIKKIALITSKTDSSIAVVQQFKRYFSKNFKGTRLEGIYISDKWSEWKTYVKNANQKADALWVLIPWGVKRVSGKPISPKEMGKWWENNLKIPSLSLVNLSFTSGVMASISVHPKFLGEATGQIIIENKIEKRPIGEIQLVYLDKAGIVIDIVETDKIGIEVPIELLEYVKIAKRDRK